MIEPAVILRFLKCIWHSNLTKKAAVSGIDTVIVKNIFLSWAHEKSSQRMQNM